MVVDTSISETCRMHVLTIQHDIILASLTASLPQYQARWSYRTLGRLGLLECFLTHEFQSMFISSYMESSRLVFKSLPNRSSNCQPDKCERRRACRRWPEAPRSDSTSTRRWDFGRAKGSRNRPSEESGEDAVVAAENWELGKGCCRRVAACCCGEASHDLKRRSVLLFTKLLFLCFFL